MAGRLVRVWAVAAAGLVTVPVAGCVDRILVPAQCGDGVAVHGEACFGDALDTFRVPFTALALRAGVFDGDDEPDVLVTGVDAAGAVLGSLSRGDGDGRFAAAQDAAVFGCSAHPATGDADGDGAIDLLVDACDDTMMIFLAGQDGHFAAPVVVDVDVATRTSAIYDVDADGNADVIALGTAGDVVALAWARGDGFGAWGPPTSTVVGRVGAIDEPTAFSIGRLDGDALPDVVLSHADATQPPRLAIGTGGAFAEPVPWPELPPSRGVASLEVAGGGDPELVVVGTDGTTFEVWRGRVGAVRRLASTTIDDAATRVLSAGHIDGDDALDLAFFDPQQTDVVVWLGDREGGWDRSAAVEVGDAVEQLAIVDLDDDGAAELVAGTFASGTVTVVHSDP